MKDINPCYADLQINDTNEVHQAMAALPGQLFDTQNVIDDDTLVQLDRVALGNPAHSVDHPDMQPLHDDQQNDASLDIENGHPQSIDHVFLNPRNRDDSIAISRGVQQSAQEQILIAIRNLAPQVMEKTEEVMTSSCHLKSRC